MFPDISDFAKKFFIEYTQPNHEQIRKIMHIDLGETSGWEVNFDTLGYEEEPDDEIEDVEIEEEIKNK